MNALYVAARSVHYVSAMLLFGGLIFAMVLATDTSRGAGGTSTPAWAGHAAAGEGSDLVIQLVSDIVHLLAAGAWLGALPALVYFLRRAPSHAAAAHATRRFSILGVASVSALVVTGLANTWYLVG